MKLRYIAAITLIMAAIVVAGCCGSTASNDNSPPVTTPYKVATPLPTAIPVTPTPTLAPTLTPDQYKASCQAITYDELARNTDTHISDDVKVSGKITQVTDEGMTILIDMAAQDDYTPRIVYLDYYGDSKFLEGDQVEVYGWVEGTMSYTTVMGADKEVPQIDAQYIDLIKAGD